MKVKIKNKNNKDVVKEIDSNLLGDYLATGEWEKVEDNKNVDQKEENKDGSSQEQGKNNKPSFKTPSDSEE